jgi:DNA-binding transcriptional LysR family regulator
MRLRFRQLQAFHATVESGTVTGAAEALGISQPGISNLLSELERQTGFALFERMHGRLIPTPEAQLMYREIETVVRGLDHVAQTVVDLQNKQIGHLQVASQHSMSFGFIPKHHVLNPQILQKEPFVIMGPDHISQRRLKDAFDAAGIALNARIHSHLFKNLLAFVNEDMAIALVDRFGLEFDADDRFVTRRFDPLIEMEMAVITSATRPLSQVGKEFLELLLERLQPYSAGKHVITRL